MAFGAIRRAYSAPCKFLSGDTRAGNRIIWYFVPRDRACYDGPTVFTPRIDSISCPPPNEHEKTGPARSIRKYTDVEDIFGFAGDHVHGDADDFMGRSPYAKYAVDGNPPTAPCHGYRGFYAGIALGVYLGDGKLIEVPLYAGLELGAVIGTGSLVQTGFYAGLELGAVIGTGSLVQTAFYAGLELGAVIGTGSLVQTAFYAGLELGAVIGTGSLVQTEFYAGLELGAIIGTGSLVQTEFYAGLELGAVIGTGSLVQTAFYAGLELGAVIGTGSTGSL